MKAVIIGDSHNLHKAYGKLPSANIIIHVGDVTTHGTKEELRGFTNWWNHLRYDFKIVIAGNHDRCLESKPELSKWFTSTYYLLDSTVVIKGTKFYGSPYTLTYQDFAFMRDRGNDIARKWAMIPDNTDILITHGPPFGYGDTTNAGVIVGCEDLLAKCIKVKPKFHLYGHVHEGYGIRKFHNTTLINASNHTGLWKKGIEYNPPHIIEW